MSKHDEEVLDNSEIELIDIFRELWKRKFIIFGVTFVASIVFLAYSISLPNTYRSSAVLAPTTNESQNGLGALASQFGGLASLAGVNIASGNNDKTTIAIEVLQSRKFLASFVEDQNIIIPLMAGTGWDEKNNKIIIDADIYNETTKEWVREVEGRKNKKPSFNEAYEHFLDILTISTDSDSGLVTLSIDYYSPFLSQKWATELVKAINHRMKYEDQESAKESIKYLNAELEKTKLADSRDLLFQLLEEQQKNLMFTEVRAEYIFKMIDPPIAPEEETGPNRLLITVVGTSLVLGLVFVFFLVRLLFFTSFHTKNQ